MSGPPQAAQPQLPPRRFTPCRPCPPPTRRPRQLRSDSPIRQGPGACDRTLPHASLLSARILTKSQILIFRYRCRPTRPRILEVVVELPPGGHEPPIRQCDDAVVVGRVPKPQPADAARPSATPAAVHDHHDHTHSDHPAEPRHPESSSFSPRHTTCGPPSTAGPNPIQRTPIDRSPGQPLAGRGVAGQTWRADLAR